MTKDSEGGSPGPVERVADAQADTPSAGAGGYLRHQIEEAPPVERVRPTDLSELAVPVEQPGQSEFVIPVHDAQAASRKSALTAFLGTIFVAVILHFGQSVFMPLAFAMLISFALSPVVNFLKRKGASQIVAVVAAVILAFLGIGLFILLVVWQFTGLAAELPRFQGNIIGKIEGLTSSGSENGLMARLGNMVSEISERLDSATAVAATNAPQPVEVVERQSPIVTMFAVLLPLLSPVATVGLVVVVVVFMLLERDDLRDRFIRLLGSHDIHKTTRVISEAGSRVAQYLLTQLLVNVIYAVPIGVGLWLIGVPNAMLWGLMTLVLRFIPYLGTFLSAAFPLLMAFAAGDGWSMLLWTAGLFLIVEFTTSNVVEPWLYGSRTGVSPMAIIISAIFWTWIWGPMGLVLATPMTVVLVVLGRHIPQFEMFDILFGDTPTLDGHSRLYQRLLVGDVADCTARAIDELEEAWLADYHSEVGIPAMALAQADTERGVLSGEERVRFHASAMRFLDELDAVVEEELEETAAEPEGAAELARVGALAPVISIGGHSSLDDVAARMLGQSLAAEGAKVQVLSHDDLAPSRFDKVLRSRARCITINFLEGAPSRASLLHIRRIKRAMPQMRVGIVLWPETAGLAEEEGAIRAQAMAIGADFCANDIDEAVAEMLSTAPALPLPEVKQRSAPRRRVRVNLQTPAS